MQSTQPSEEKGRTYIAIDLKSFYASVECMARGLDPLTTNLVVADPSIMTITMPMVSKEEQKLSCNIAFGYSAQPSNLKATPVVLHFFVTTCNNLQRIAFK